MGQLLDNKNRQQLVKEGIERREEETESEAACHGTPEISAVAAAEFGRYRRTQSMSAAPLKHVFRQAAGDVPTALS